MILANQKTILTVLGACAIAAGCSLLPPQPDRSRFYILTPVPEGNSVATAPDPRLTLGVGPVEFPDYLRRLPVVTRVGPNRIELSDEKRWAEPLDKNSVRVLSENLGTLLGTQRIEKYPWPLTTKIDYQIEVDVQRFETTSDGQAQLVASWIIRDGRSESIVYASKTTAAAPAGADATSASSALSSDLATLSEAIAENVIELDQHPSAARSEPNGEQSQRDAYHRAMKARGYNVN
jgi:uncharacterized lipoprotein YmbA